MGKAPNGPSSSIPNLPEKQLTQLTNGLLYLPHRVHFAKILNGIRAAMPMLVDEYFAMANLVGDLEVAPLYGGCC